MREWHVEHMEKTVVKCTSRVCQKMHQDGRREITKNMAALQISADKLNMILNMGLPASKLSLSLRKFVMITSFSTLRKASGSMERLAEIENQFSKPKIRVPQWR